MRKVLEPWHTRLEPTGSVMLRSLIGPEPGSLVAVLTSGRTTALHFAATTSFGDGSGIKTENARQYLFNVGCGHPTSQPRERRLCYCTSPGRFRLCQCSPDYDQGMFPLITQQWAFWFIFYQDSMVNKRDYVELGLNCADICKVLDRGLNGRRLDELNKSILEAIRQLTT